MDRKIEHLVIAFLEGELTDEETERLGEYLESNPEDADEFLALARQDRVLRMMFGPASKVDVSQVVVDEIVNSKNGEEFVQKVVRRLPDTRLAARGRKPRARNGREAREHYRQLTARRRRRTVIAAIAAAAVVVAITVIIVAFSGSPSTVPEGDRTPVAEKPDRHPVPQPPEPVPPAPDIPVPEPEPEKQPTPPKPEPEKVPAPPEPESEVVIARVLRTPGGSTLTRDAHTELKHEKEPGNQVFTLSKGGVYCTTSGSEEITIKTPPARVIASEGGIFRAQLFERKEKEVKKATMLVLAVAVYLGAVTVSNEFGSEIAGPGEVVFAQEDAAPEKQVAKGNTEFALDLYAKLKDDKKGKNIFFSPFSISSALAMTYAGARGKTAEQMAAVLHFDLEQKKLHPAFAALMNKTDVGKQKGLELNIANALWGQEGYRFLDEFIALNNKSYGAGLRDVDFEGATEQARQTINKWVEDQTKNKIEELIKPGILGNDTILVLTNAIYFKGEWAEKFDKKSTHNMNFTVSADKKVKVPMMRSDKLEFKYGVPEDIEIVELPYVGKKISMVILLPKKVDGLPALEKKLTPKKLKKYLSAMRTKEMLVYLPKFKMTCAFELHKILPHMGMPDAFNPGKADFSRMTGNRELFIGKVLHKAFVEVNEEGTEAAAATMVETAKCKPLQFCADHPFLFLIRDKETDSILFMGRVVNPAEDEKVKETTHPRPGKKEEKKEENKEEEMKKEEKEKKENQ